MELQINCMQSLYRKMEMSQRKIKDIFQLCLMKQKLL